MKQNIQLWVKITLMSVYWFPVNSNVDLAKNGFYSSVFFLCLFFIYIFYFFIFFPYFRSCDINTNIKVFVIQQWDSEIEGQVETISHIKSSGTSAQSSFIKIRLIFAGVARLKICVFHYGNVVPFCQLLVVVALRPGQLEQTHACSRY